jgi:protein N-terminal glutamine amidohydrolase
VRRYQPFYCEENVWWLLHDLAAEAQAVFITNAGSSVALWEQRAAPPGEPVIWDYHAIAIADGQAWDLDSRLGLPVPLGRYLVESFHFLPPAAAAFAPRFRLVPAALFHARFASDRSHMRVGGRWLKPPPPWPPPQPVGIEPTNLKRFLDLDDPIAGEVVDLQGLRHRFGLVA